MPKIKLKTFYINYSDIIDMPRVKAIMAITSQIIEKEKPDCLYFLFSSHGGDVDSGVSLYNYLLSLPVKIIMHNIGSIDSIANVIFVAGKERYANPHSVFLFHGVVMNFNGQAAFSLPQLKEMTDRINKNHETIAGILCEKTKVKQNEVKKLFSQGETKNTQFALKKGIINKVKIAKIPKNAPFITININ